MWRISRVPSSITTITRRHPWRRRLAVKWLDPNAAAGSCVPAYSRTSCAAVHCFSRGRLLCSVAKRGDRPRHYDASTIEVLLARVRRRARKENGSAGTTSHMAWARTQPTIGQSVLRRTRGMPRRYSSAAHFSRRQRIGGGEARRRDLARSSSSTPLDARSLHLGLI